MKKGLTTEKTFALWIIGLYIGFVWATFFPNAPFSAFSVALTGGLGVVAGKRLFQKHRKFGNNEYVEED